MPNLSNLSFENYLAQPEIIDKLQMNMTRYVDTENGHISLSRLFNDLPLNYAGFQPLLDTVTEAFRHDELKLWFDFAVYMAMYDLLECDGRIKPSIYPLLNIRETGQARGVLDALLETKPLSHVAGLLVSAYITLLGSRTLTALQNAMRECLDIPDFLDRPDTQCSVALNQWNRELQSIDADSISGMQQVMIMATGDESIQSLYLVDAIESFLLYGHDVTPMYKRYASMTLFGSCLSGLSAMVGELLEPRGASELPRRPSGSSQ